jgi:hypothetical protein
MMATRISGTVGALVTFPDGSYTGLVTPNVKGYADPHIFTNVDVIFGGALKNGQVVFFEAHGTMEKVAKNIRTDQ